LQEKLEQHKINPMVGLWEWFLILATGVWVGCEDRSARFKGITYGQGATAALPIWGIFMKKCYGDNNSMFLKKNSKDQKIYP
jgi:membrane carboxypeptidase/penicillin-binding protein